LNVVVDPVGSFAYVANQNSNDVSVYRIDSTTGALTQVAGSPFAAGTNPRSIAID
jgi:YVTN family beta-propeller protein